MPPPLFLSLLKMRNIILTFRGPSGHGYIRITDHISIIRTLIFRHVAFIIYVTSVDLQQGDTSGKKLAYNSENISGL